MIVNLLNRFKNVILKQKIVIQLFLLLSGTILIFKKPSQTKVTANTLLFKKLEYPYKISPIKFIDEFDQIKSPANTILIVCEEKDSSNLDLIYGSIKNFTGSYRDIVVTKKRKLYSKYFTVIYLSFGDETHTKIFPLKNTQPNSDLASISLFYFPNKYFFNIRDLIYEPDLNFGFTLFVQIQYSRQDIKHFFTFIRSLVNVDGFTSGKYFYIPFQNTNIDISDLFLFCLFVFLSHFLDWITEFKSGCSVTTFLNFSFFYFFPLSAPICLYFKRERIFLALIYYFIHFRYGFICFIYLYILGLTKTIPKLIKK